jgi:hypothetical protein
VAIDRSQTLLPGSLDATPLGGWVDRGEWRINLGAPIIQDLHVGFQGREAASGVDLNLSESRLGCDIWGRKVGLDVGAKNGCPISDGMSRLHRLRLQGTNPRFPLPVEWLEANIQLV